MTRSSYSRIIRKRSRKIHKFQPILSASRCECEDVCLDCMKRMAEQAANERPEHIWTVRNGELAFLEDVVMEHHLGRELKPTETVIHKNGLPTDNRFENLEVVTIDKLETE